MRIWDRDYSYAISLDLFFCQFQLPTTKPQLDYTYVVEFSIQSGWLQLSRMWPCGVALFSRVKLPVGTANRRWNNEPRLVWGKIHLNVRIFCCCCHCSDGWEKYCVLQTKKLWNNLTVVAPAQKGIRDNLTGFFIKKKIRNRREGRGPAITTRNTQEKHVRFRCGRL